jgi:phage N-6-adenine-methyltransferase
MELTNMKVHYASEKQTWETPQDFFDLMDSEFHFDVDVCAEDETAKCNIYYTVDDDGLSKEWNSICWMNPPYGREIGKWMKKAYESAEYSGATVVCLVPARTDTKWWHNYAMKANEVRFIRGRLRFGNATASAPFPSAVVVFRPFSTPMGFEVKTQEKQFTFPEWD